MKIKGIEVQMEVRDAETGNSRIERMGVLPINLDTKTVDVFNLRINMLPETGGILTHYVNLSWLRDQ